MVKGKKQSITLMNMDENSSFEKYEIEPPYFDVISHLDRTAKTIYNN